MMRRTSSENVSISDTYENDGFTLALLRTEARRQVWTCTAICGLILAVLLAAILAETA
jgi:hypothetical protein